MGISFLNTPFFTRPPKGNLAGGSCQVYGAGTQVLSAGLDRTGQMNLFSWYQDFGANPPQTFRLTLQFSPDNSHWFTFYDTGVITASVNFGCAGLVATGGFARGVLILTDGGPGVDADMCFNRTI